MTGTVLSGSVLVEINFLGKFLIRTVLTWSIFTESFLVESFLVGSILAGPVSVESDLIGSVFNNCFLPVQFWTRTILVGTNFIGSVFDQLWILPEICWNSASLSSWFCSFFLIDRVVIDCVGVWFCWAFNVVWNESDCKCVNCILVKTIDWCRIVTRKVTWRFGVKCWWSAWWVFNLKILFWLISRSMTHFNDSY